MPANRREVNVLINGLRERVPADLLNSSTAVPVELLIGRLTKRLQDNQGLTEEMARWAVESWALALRKASPEQFSKSQGYPTATAESAARPVPPSKPPAISKPARFVSGQPVAAYPIVAPPPTPTNRRPFWIGLGTAGAIAIVAAVAFYALKQKSQLASQATSVPANSAIPTASAAPSASTAQATAASSSFTPSGTISGQNPAFVFVDMQRIFKQYNKTKAAEQKINDHKNVAKVEYDNKADAYKRALDEINALNKRLESANLSTDAKLRLARQRDDKIADIKNMEREISDFRTTREKQLQDELLQLREGIVNEITRTISDLISPQANLVIDTSGTSINGVPALVFSPTASDMSDRVISVLNSNQSQELLDVRSIPIASVDMQRAFKEYNKTKDAEVKINDAKNAAKKEYDDRAEAYKKALDEINALNRQLESSRLSADRKTQTAKKRDDKIANIKAMEREINDFRQTRERQLQEQLMRMREGIVKEIEQVIRDGFVKSRQCIVLDTSGQSVNGALCTVYLHGVPNITPEVIDRLNNGPALATSTASSFASSDTLRFARVDMKRVFETLPETKKAAAEIDATKKQRGAKQKETEDLAQQKRQKIVDKIVAEVTSEANQQGLNVVFDSSGVSINGVPFFMVSRNLPDLTGEIIANLGGRE